MPKFNILKPTIQQTNRKQIFGFDVETYGRKNKFYCASVWHENSRWCRTFFTKKECINYFKLKRFRNSLICATNLQFDLFALLHNDPEINNFMTLFRGSHLLFAKTYLKNGKEGFHRKYEIGSYALTFLDSLNYAGLSVQALGRILAIEKLSKPQCLGRLPENSKEKNELVIYNMRDSEISAKALKFLYDSFEEIGATPKITIASTSMSLFKNKYLQGDYFRHHINELDFEFRGYYGGRTEVFNRGLIENYRYYDVNSLYPFVMQKFEYPDPNSIRKTRKDTLDYIKHCEGMSLVDLYCPYMTYPLLPFRRDFKLLFPTGDMRGVYTHIELRRALDLGYTIKKVYNTYYFKKTIEPFKEFVRDLYTKRLKYKEEGSKMEYVTKILMNSLYGKFGQQFRNRDNWVPIPLYEDFLKLGEEVFERIGNYIRIKKKIDEPRTFCVPIWASYITAYARIHLHKLIQDSNAVYCDTDSIMTTKRLITGDNLGELKLEMKIKEGIIIKPKMYAVKNLNQAYVKVKGLGIRLNYQEFISLIKNGRIKYDKFCKFKESLRRNFDPNEIIAMEKNFSMEDTKRLWYSCFNKDKLEVSKPLDTRHPTKQIAYNEYLEMKLITGDER